MTSARLGGPYRGSREQVRTRAVICARSVNKQAMGPEAVWSCFVACSGLFWTGWKEENPED